MWTIEGAHIIRLISIGIPDVKHTEMHAQYLVMFQKPDYTYKTRAHNNCLIKKYYFI